MREARARFPALPETCLRRQSRRRLRQPDEVGLPARFAHLRVLHLVGFRRPIGAAGYCEVRRSAGVRLYGGFRQLCIIANFR